MYVYIYIDTYNIHMLSLAGGFSSLGNFPQPATAAAKAISNRINASASSRHRHNHHQSRTQIKSKIMDNDNVVKMIIVRMITMLMFFHS